MASKSIAKRANGKWRARYRDDTGKEHARHFERKVDAQRWLDEVTTSVVTGQYVDPAGASVTFNDWFIEWASVQAWAPTTAASAEIIRRAVPFGSVPLAKLTEGHLEQWIKDMRTDGLAPGTILTRFATVRAALKAAVRRRRLGVDPSVGVSNLPRRASQSQTLEYATPDEVQRLVKASDDRMRTFVAVCAFAGLRLGEASGLQVGDVDFLRRQIHVRRQVQRHPGGPSEVKPPKYESYRSIPAADELLQLIAHHVQVVPSIGDDGWLFANMHGGPVPPTTVGMWWSKLRTDAGVPHLHMHALRHHYASGLIAQGCDVVMVQRAMGHKSPSITLDTYSHLWPSAEDKTRQASSSLIAGSLGSAADWLRTEGGGKGA